jgi:integrase
VQGFLGTGNPWNLEQAPACKGLLKPFWANREQLPWRSPLLMPRLSSTTPRWVTTLRWLIKQQHGVGWAIREQSGRVKLSRRWKDGTSESAMLPLAWDRSSSTSIANWLNAIHQRMEDAGLPLRDAVELQSKAMAFGLSAAAMEPLPSEDAIDWHEVVARFRKHKTSDTGECRLDSFDRNYGLKMQQFLEVVRRRPIPRDARTTLATLRDNFGGEPGSAGRRQRIQYCAQLLRFAVEECGAPEPWRPPDNLSSFIGKTKREASSDGTPIQDEQLIRLLAGIPDHRWRMAVGLCAVYGLRPVELRHIRRSADGRGLHCSYVKQTARGGTRPGDILGIDPIGLPGLAHELLQALERTPMPPLGLASNTVATAISTYLRRRPIWRELREEAAAKGEQLTCYSFRHGYALRAHLVAELPPRVAAQQMRHSLQTHLRHYGRWCDAETAAATMDRALAKVAEKQLQAA